MKRLFILFIPSCLLCSCGNSGKTKIASTRETHSTVVVTDTEGFVDPVCGMIKDSTWTDFTIYKGDTVWFCAESEKKAFERNPAKYESKLKYRK